MIKIAVDLGTSVTKIYLLGSGIVLSEATCLTVNKETGRIHAYGDDAKKLLGRAADTDVIFPVAEGEVRHEEYAGALLDHFLGKVLKRRFGVEAVFCVPCGCTPEQRTALLHVAQAAKISRAGFIESPYLVALGAGVSLSDSNNIFAIDLGAGKTSIAAFSRDGMSAGLTLGLGGNSIDVRIIDHIAQRYNLKIGASSAEKLKNKLGCLIEGDRQSAIVNGRDMKTGKPRSVSVMSEDLYKPISAYADTVAEYVELLLPKLQAEVSAAICKNGVYLAGGVSALPGLAEYFATRLQMETRVGDDPQMTVILGGGRAIGDSALASALKMS